MSHGGLFTFRSPNPMKTTFPRSSLSERSLQPDAPASTDARVTALLFAGLLAASFYGETLRWNDRQPPSLLNASQREGASAAPAKPVPAQKISLAAIAGR